MPCTFGLYATAHVVQEPQDGDEVGNEVERHGQIGEERAHEQLATGWHAGIAQERAQEEQAVGEEARHRSRVPAPADEHQADEQRRVDDQRHAQSEQ